MGRLARWPGRERPVTQCRQQSGQPISCGLQSGSMLTPLLTALSFLFPVSEFGLWTCPGFFLMMSAAHAVRPGRIQIQKEFQANLHPQIFPILYSLCVVVKEIAHQCPGLSTAAWL